MGSLKFLWDVSKSCLTAGLISLTFSDRFASIVPVRGTSMSPTFNPITDSSIKSSSDDYVLLEKLCLEKYKFSQGDVVVFRSPSNYKEKHIKRIIGLPGDWVGTPHSYDVIEIPKGHCWVEGDNSLSSMDSKTFGPVPLGLIQGRVTHIVWPPQRIGEVKRSIPPGRLPFS
ncbi:Peptidase_S24 domain-containing protein [Cephalotus follicularis]|uniref:Mitochondrial inner membrane protease subunit 2 n=1 Tax=Cephalotus follicularis TaxID=3775 RepID=A0A1Q3C5B2_CEPFO|nr:Peptidase_S24 domain-containing protein [Cephalotus follicularis]